MSYAQSVLQPGETIVVTGHLHWIIYTPAMFFLVVGTIAVWIEHRTLLEADVLIAGTAITFGGLFLWVFGKAWFTRWITEFAVTNRRVISKRGFIWRETEEMNMDKVETVDIDQTIWGRILGYGDIRITGTGGTNNIEVRRMAQPFALRNAIIAK